MESPGNIIPAGKRVNALLAIGVLITMFEESAVPPFGTTYPFTTREAPELFQTFIRPY